jgi:hypothetical protein
VLAAAILLGAGSGARAETHTTIPGCTVNAGAVYKDVVVDSAYHWVYTINASNQVQFSYYSAGAWNTVPLTAFVPGAQPVKASGCMYVSPSTHVLFYVGADNRIWYWWFSGSTFLNGQLNATDTATNLMGVDPIGHYLWYRALAPAGSLRVLYFNGSAWVSRATSVTDCNDGSTGGIVDPVSHTVFWADNTLTDLRGLAPLNGRALVPITLDGSASSNFRPAVQGNGAIYFRDTGDSLARVFINSDYGYERQVVNMGGATTFTSFFGSVGVHPTTGKIWVCRFIATVSIDIAVLTPTGSGAGTTWSTTIVPGTSGHYIYGSGLDESWNIFYYTTGTDSLLHAIY